MPAAEEKPEEAALETPALEAAPIEATLDADQSAPAAEEQPLQAALETPTLDAAPIEAAPIEASGHGGLCGGDVGARGAVARPARPRCNGQLLLLLLRLLLLRLLLLLTGAAASTSEGRGGSEGVAEVTVGRGSVLSSIVIGCQLNVTSGGEDSGDGWPWSGGNVQVVTLTGVITRSSSEKQVMGSVSITYASG